MCLNFDISFGQSIKDAQKRGKKFLRKGDGASRIGKNQSTVSDPFSPKQVKAGFPKLQQQVAPPIQFSRLMTGKALPVAQKPSGATVGLGQGTGALNMGQKSALEKSAPTTWPNAKAPVAAAAAHLCCPGERGICPVPQSQASANYTCAPHEVGNKKRGPQDPIQCSNSRRNSLHQAFSSDREAASVVSLQAAGAVAFKKVNDQIVRVCQRAPHWAGSESDGGQSNSRSDGPKVLSLAAELVQSLSTSSSSSESSVDGPEWQDHRSPVSPSPTTLPRRDQNLDLSDGDYASDAPSETGPRPAVQTQTRTSYINSPRPSSSSEHSDSELTTGFFWNRAGTPSTAAEVKLSAASQLLSSIFPKLESAGKRPLHGKQEEKFLSSKDNRLGE